MEISSLRKTSNNLPKFEHEEDKEGKKSDIVNETNNMKKKGNYELYHSLNNPEKCEKKNQLLSKKSPNSIK